MKMEHVTTNDFQAAAFFKARGYEPTRVERVGDRKLFVFDVPHGLETEYYNRSGTASARALFDAYFAIKTMAFSI